MPKRTPKQYDRFAKLADALLAVPRSEIKEKLDAHKATVDANPKRRGPKRKSETTQPSDESASPDTADAGS